MLRSMKPARAGGIVWNPLLRIGFLLCGLLFAGCGLTYFVWRDRQSATEMEAKNLTDSLARAANLTNRALYEVDLVLAEDARQIAALNVQKQEIHSAAILSGMRETLIRQTASLPMLISMSVFDRNGRLIISSRFPSPPPLSLNRQREIWTASLASDGTRSFVLAENNSLVLAVPTIVVGRSVRTSDGESLGCVLAFPSREVILSQFNYLVEGGRSSCSPIPMAGSFSDHSLSHKMFRHGCSHVGNIPLLKAVAASCFRTRTEGRGLLLCRGRRMLRWSTPSSSRHRSPSV